MTKYPIYYCDQVVGNAQMDKQGLFYVIRCKCNLPQDRLYKVLITSKDDTFDLGICTRSDKGIGLVTRISANTLKSTELRFTVEPEQHEIKKMYAVSENSEFPDLEIIYKAKFLRREGKAYICPD